MEKPKEKSLSEPLIPTIEIVLQGIEKGLGFNIVGGADTPHIPGHDGFFVSKIRPNSAASDNGRLSVGDRIVAVDGTVITKMTHDQAVKVFKGASGQCTLTVEPDAERILLSQPSDLIVRSPASTSRTFKSNSGQSSRSSSPTKNQNSCEKENSKPDKKGDEKVVKEEEKAVKIEAQAQMAPPLEVKEGHNSSHNTENSGKRRKTSNSFSKSNDSTANGAIPTSKNVQHIVPHSPAKAVRSRTMSSTSSHFNHSAAQRHLNQVPDEEDDGASVVSMAPSIAHSVIDDIPRTPKKSANIFDPSNPSILTEVLFVSIGVVALGAGVIFAYRYWRRS
ncbi:unnamed protein product [Bursaphelenchus okinawaensis]|uniref:PDZ domain-containing protein n=1 Tax=Bursaphelenchus okinawaensis TaxID=465554 RepID=A0A811LAG5_9BILA|nr:unnamed protein product [Bursaphelenchus okinawaensis]CAG9119998.1 unnamed protein product [Bursaphelenchus okinawaensis]